MPRDRNGSFEPQIVAQGQTRLDGFRRSDHQPGCPGPVGSRDPVYPVIFFDALQVKIRDEGLVRNKAVYVALALNSEGEKEVRKYSGCGSSTPKAPSSG